MKYLLFFLLPIIGSANPKLDKFINQYCLECHDSLTEKGKVNLENFSLSIDHIEIAEKINKLLRHHEMPPLKEKIQPKLNERQDVINILDEFLLRESKTISPNFRRLTHREYDHIMIDRLGKDYGLIDKLPEEGYGDHFLNHTKYQFISSHEMKGYLDVAKQIAESVIVDQIPKVKIVHELAENLRFGFQDKFLKEEQVIKLLYKKLLETGAYFSNHQIEDEGIYKITIEGQTQNFKTDNEYLNINIGNPEVSSTYKKIGELPIGQKLGIYTTEVIFKKGDQFILNLRESDEKPEKGRGIDIPQVHLKSITLEGPFIKSWPPKVTQRVFDDLNYKDKRNTTQAITRLLQSFIGKSLNQKLIHEYYEVYKKSYHQSSRHLLSLKNVLITFLCSKDFLYRLEMPNVEDSNQLANRLSHFLWNSQPDARLMKLAKEKKLLNRKILLTEAKRLFTNKKIDRFLEDFTKQWLELYKVGQSIPNRYVYNRYKKNTKELIEKETIEYVKLMFKENLSLSHFIASDFVVTNKELAIYYGYKKENPRHPFTEGFSKYQLPRKSQRGGLLTQASFLNMTSDGENTSPILRGVWIMKNIYGMDLEPPSAVPSVEPDIRNAKTVKEVIEAHKQSDSCNRCHSKIDPMGLPLENFDVIGLWREEYKKIKASYSTREASQKFGKKIKGFAEWESMALDSKVKLENGVSIETPNQLKQEMLKDLDKISKAWMKKVLTYALGRDLKYYEEKELDVIYREASAKGLGMQDVILTCIGSSIFMKG